MQRTPGVPPATPPRPSPTGGGGRTAGFCTFVPVIVSLVVGQAPPCVYIHDSGEGVCKRGIINIDGRGGNATPSPALPRCGRYASCEGGGRAAGFCTLVPAIASAWWGKPHPTFTYTVAGKVYVNGESSTSMAEAGTLPPPQPSPAAGFALQGRENFRNIPVFSAVPLRRRWRGRRGGSRCVRRWSRVRFRR